jgi:hypothetical protein
LHTKQRTVKNIFAKKVSKQILYSTVCCLSLAVVAVSCINIMLGILKVSGTGKNFEKCLKVVFGQNFYIY